MEYDVDDVVKVRGAYGIVTSKTLQDDGTVEYAVRALRGESMWLASEEAMEPSDRGFSPEVLAEARASRVNVAQLPVAFDLDEHLEDLCHNGASWIGNYQVAIDPIERGNFSLDLTIGIYWRKVD